MDSQENKEIKTETNDKSESKAPESGDAKEKQDFADLEENSLPPIVTKNVVLPMSQFGIGPVYGLIVIALTAFGLFFRKRWIFESGIPSSDVLKYIYIGFGVLLILIGGKLFLDAQFTERIGDHIDQNKLCTTGVYAWTRNPIYAALLFISTGILFISGNVYMYFIPILLWIILTLLLKNTEERELFRRFDQEFADYVAKVNRVFPKPPAK